MKATGIVRKIDDLGRIVIPMETRRILGIKEKDALEIYVDGEHIILKKYEPGCKSCGDVVQLFGEAQLCARCIEQARRAMGQ